jgi:hypothetical protein
MATRGHTARCVTAVLFGLLLTVVALQARTAESSASPLVRSAEGTIEGYVYNGVDSRHFSPKQVHWGADSERIVL